MSSVFAAPLSAASKTDWNPSCHEMVAMGYDNYQYGYELHGGDLSTLGMKQSASHYADCKSADNERRAAKLSSSRRRLILSARDALHDYESALWAMVEVSAGGGTMYGVFNASSAAYSEDIIGQVIGAAQRAKRNTGARRIANTNLAVAVRQLAPHLQAPALDDGVINAQAQREYRKAAQTAAAMRERLQTLAARLPDEAAALLSVRIAYDARHVFDEI